MIARAPSVYLQHACPSVAGLWVNSYQIKPKELHRVSVRFQQRQDQVEIAVSLTDSVSILSAVVVLCRCEEELGPELLADVTFAESAALGDSRLGTRQGRGLAGWIREGSGGDQEKYE